MGGPTFSTAIGRYARILLQTLPGTNALCFDDVVPKTPKSSSAETRRVAAAAFYHCLGECVVCLSGCVVMFPSSLDQRPGQIRARRTVWENHNYDQIDSVVLVTVIATGDRLGRTETGEIRS